jgi:hypothetical protein
VNDRFVHRRDVPSRGRPVLLWVCASAPPLILLAINILPLIGYRRVSLRDPLPLEYANKSDDLVGSEPLRQRLILGMLSLIGSVAAVALVGLGAAMYRSGGAAAERRLGLMSSYTSLAVAILALAIALAARSRAREVRGLANLAVASNFAYWATGAALLLWP